MLKKIISKQPDFYDVDSFLSDNQRFTLTLIMRFFLLSRAFAILSLLVSYNIMEPKTFLIRLILYSISFIFLLFALTAIKKRRTKIIMSIVIVNMIVGIITLQCIVPIENQVVDIITLAIQLAFVVMIFYLILHNKKTNFIVFCVTNAILIINCYLYNKKALQLYGTSSVSLSFIYVVVFAFVSLAFFIHIITLEHKKITNFIKGLTYVDYSISLPNEKRLIEDYSAFPPDIPLTFIGIYVINLSSLNRQYGYKNVQIELLKRIDEIKDELNGCSKLYKLSEPIFVFAFNDDEKALNTLLKKVDKILSRTTKCDDSMINFKMNVIGTKAPSDGKNAEELLANLQIIKYSFVKDDKSTGDVFWYNSSLLSVNERTLTLEKDIHTAIKNKKIRIAIQPKIAVSDSSKSVAGEVLARWHHEIYGEITPLEFIPLVEREGLMDEFTSLIIHHTDNLINEYRKQKGVILNLSVNISASSLVTGSLNKILLIDRANKLKEIGGLELEFTESVLFDLSEDCKQHINDLKNAGYRIAIDDFGTGFSNFEYLQEFEIDTLKIDKKFVDKLTESEKSNIVADAIIKIAHTLGAIVVAEGVEQKSQAEQLKNLNCDYIQGYYFSKPLPPQEFLEFVSNGTEHLI